MRQFRFHVRLPDDGLNSVGRAIASDDSVTREAIVWLNLLRDGTATAVYELSGKPAAIEPHLDTGDDILEHSIFDIDEERCALYVCFEPDEAVEALIAIHDHYPIVIDLPIPVRTDGTLTLTIASTQSTAQEAFGAVPSEVEVNLEHIGDFRMGQAELEIYLTDRQLEVLQTAVEHGYYELPSQVTQADLAVELSCSAATVGTHLRKAEARLVRAIVGAGHSEVRDLARRPTGTRYLEPRRSRHRLLVRTSHAQSLPPRLSVEHRTRRARSRSRGGPIHCVRRRPSPRRQTRVPRSSA
ncbi:MAG: helix-turn-helix domain-containing protein [Natrialbaceae archaeon]|nr:helix-turn-helix domain-containing protein [Natrialbaceae archaeon]